MTPVHVLVHILGFVHEHMRPDRDDLILINYDNIKHGEEKHFEIREPGTSDFFEKGSVDITALYFCVLWMLHDLINAEVPV